MEMHVKHEIWKSIKIATDLQKYGTIKNEESMEITEMREYMEVDKN